MLGSDSVDALVSVDVGCVRLTERHLHSDPPTSDQIAWASADIDGALEAVWAVVPVGQARTLVGLAGSVTTVAAMALGLPAYDATRIHHAQDLVVDVTRVSDALLGMSHDERAALPFMHPGRVDVIGAGALVLAATHAAVRVRLRLSSASTTSSTASPGRSSLPEGCVNPDPPRQTPRKGRRRGLGGACPRPPGGRPHRFKRGGRVVPGGSGEGRGGGPPGGVPVEEALPAGGINEGEKKIEKVGRGGAGGNKAYNLNRGGEAGGTPQTH